MDRELANLVAEIRQSLAQPDPTTLKGCLARLHPSDLAEVIEELSPEEGARILALLDEENAAETLDDLESQTQREVLAELDAPKLAGIIEQMADDDLADLVAELGAAQAEQVLGLMEAEDRHDLRQLMSYPADTAGGIMTTEFVWVEADLTAEQAIDHLRRLAPGAETINYIYVLDPEGKLCGVLSLRDLILASPGTLIREVMETDLVVATVTDDQEEVARSVMHYDLLAVPVVDERGRMLGIVTSDDMMDVAQTEATEDFHRTAAISPLEGHYTQTGALQLVKRRMGWLLGLVLVNLMSSGVIAIFEETLAATIALAFFMPLLIDSGGNIGSQAATIMIRGLVTGDLSPDRWLRTLAKEATVGGLLGLAMGAAASLLGLYRGGYELALVVGLTMVVLAVLANLVGAMLPFIFTRLRIDPAVASGPLITTVADTVGLVIYFSIARIFLT